MRNLYPLKFKPILKSLVWGGDKIAPFKGVEADSDRIGESWELSGVRGNESVVANGELEGRTIAELVKEYKEALVGEHIYMNTGDEFPLLIKFIDAKQDLSIQVHPDDEMAARRHHGSKGKTEMWYVVDAEDNAHLRSGLDEEVTPDEYEAKVEDGTITDILHDYNVKPGDVFFLPAGRIHSIGAGCFIAEIQQTSDITYRIYDFGRLGLDGKPRELHTELAKEAIDYTVHPDYRTAHTDKKNAENILVECKYFTTSLFDIDREYSKDMSDLDSFLVVICIGGAGKIEDGFGNSVPVHQGETVLVPACSPSATFIPDGTMKILTSRI
ncbi:MAG: type I phosphomannose isomerase catalytic subunit [Candidatus Cryptobacteroides sp.]